MICSKEQAFVSGEHVKKKIILNVFQLVFAFSVCALSVLGNKSVAENLGYSLLTFFQRIGFDIPCKLSPKEISNITF